MRCDALRKLLIIQHPVSIHLSPHMPCFSVWQHVQVLRDAHSLAALKQDLDAEADASTGDSAATPFAAQAESEKVRSWAGCGQDSWQTVWYLRCCLYCIAAHTLAGMWCCNTVVRLGANEGVEHKDIP